MTILLSSTAIAEKNKLSTDGAWLVFCKIELPSETIRLVSNDVNVTWQGEVWTRFPFEIDAISEVSTGEVSRVDLRVSNVSRVMQSYIEAYDVYTKANGFSPIPFTVYMVNSKDLAAGTASREFIFELKKPKADAHWVTFTIGASNPFERRFPLGRILKNSCRYWAFKTDPRCAYAGAETTCDRTLTRCRELGNSARFGGFPGVGRSGVLVAR